MASERDTQKRRATQVGMLMRAYRETFVNEDGRKGLTQEELLRRMAAVDVAYGERYSHATVSRWESGTTRPEPARLRSFSKALLLSQVEEEGLMLLAGFPPHNGSMAEAISPGDGGGERDLPATAQPKSQEGTSVGGGPIFFAETRSIARSVIQLVLFRYLALGLAIVGIGIGLALVGWNDGWMPLAYVGLAIALVLGQGIFAPSRDAELREFLSVSLFVVLSTPLVQFAPLRMDHYGLYTIGDLYGTHMPYMLALLANLTLAMSAGLMFQVLVKWQRSAHKSGSSSLRRAAWAVVPPVSVVYLAAVTFSNISVWIQLAVLIPALGMVFTILLVLRDPAVTLSLQDRRFMLNATVTVGVVSGTLGIIVIFVVYMSPGMPMVLPDHNLLTSWVIDFEALGYTREEALGRLNLGYLWHAMCVFVYMTAVVGSNFIADIYRAGPDQAHPRKTALPGSSGQDEVAEVLQLRTPG